jgi:predicted ATPase
MYLDKFILPIEMEDAIIQTKISDNGGYIDDAYPCNIFLNKQLKELNFDKITILYGGNGSGKSTLLNLISQKIKLKRIAPFNTSETFDMYVDKCKYETGFNDEGDELRIPNGSRIITSDDVFDYMLAIRTNNNDIAENKFEAREDFNRIKYGETVKVHGMEDYEVLRTQVLARKRSYSRRKYIRSTAGQEIVMQSNGETAFEYFDSKLKNDTLYCLDEPENSLSPKLQLKLVTLLEELAHYCGCQFIIATHSPFLLAMKFTKIYDLDETPVTVKEWYELENTKLYFDFFYKNKVLFIKSES